MKRLLKKLLKEPGIRSHIARKKAYFFPNPAEVPEKILDMWVRDWLIHEIACAHMKYPLGDLYIEYIDTVHGGNVPLRCDSEESMPLIENICLFDMDGTLCDYESALAASMEKLRAPEETPYAGVPKDDAPEYLRARANLIRANVEWWAALPKFQLGFNVWEIAGQLGYRRMILTAGPKRNANAWTGKKLWIDRNLGQDVDITITRDKGLVYGKILVDDWPEYILRWLEWRPRGLVIMPASQSNGDFKHSQVIRYDGSRDSIEQVAREMRIAMQRVDM